MGRSPRVRRGLYATSRQGGLQVTRGVLSSIPVGIPDRTFVKLQYAQNYILSSTSGAVVDLVLLGNSMFDPAQTTGADQPQYFAELSALYGRYTVFGSTCRMRGILNGSGGYVASRMCLVPSLVSTAILSSVIASTMPYAKAEYHNLTADFFDEKTYMSTAKMFGVPKSAVATEVNYNSAVNASPTSLWYWHCWTQPGDGATTGTGLLEVQITYYAVLSSRTNPDITP